MRLACLSSLLLFTAWVSSIIAHERDGRETPIISARRGDLNNGDDTATMATLTISNNNGGRKMFATQKVMKKLEKRNGIIDGVERAAGSKDLGGTYDNQVMKGSKVKCKNNHSNCHFSYDDDDDDDTGFEVVFSKDYHLPSHHPPKNN